MAGGDYFDTILNVGALTDTFETLVTILPHSTKTLGTKMVINPKLFIVKYK